MAVNSTEYKKIYNTNGTTGPFAITFPVRLDSGGDAADIKVYYRTAAGVETDITSACTIEGLNVTLGTAYAAGGKIALVREPELKQLSVYSYGTRFPASQFESDLDYSMFCIQKVESEIARGIRAPITDAAADLEIPNEDDRKGKFLYFNVDTGLPEAAAGAASVPVSAFMATVVDDADAGAALTTLGVTAYAQTLLDDADASTARSTLSVRKGDFEIVTTEDSALPIRTKSLIRAAAVKLPASAVAGEVIEIATDADGPTTLSQVDAENSIMYRNWLFTTKGTTGKIVLKPKTRLQMYYRGTGTSRIDTPAKVAALTAPEGYGNGAAFSPDGTYLAVAHTTSPYITVYKRSGDTFTKVDALTAPEGDGDGAAFSPDGTYLAVAHTTSPYITVYKRSGDTFTKVDALTAPEGNGNGAAFSPDGTYLAVAHNGSPYATVYKRSGDTFAKVTALAALPGVTAGYACAFSPDGTYLAFGSTGTPYATVYKRSGDTFTKVTALAALDGTAYGCAFSPDGQYLAYAHDGTPYATVYKRSGDTFTKVTALAALDGIGRGCSFSPDGQYLAYAHDGTPYATVYKRSGDTFTKVTALAALDGIGIKCAFSPNGQYLAYAHTGTPYITVYKTVEAVTKQWEIVELETPFETDKLFMFQ